MPGRGRVSAARPLYELRGDRIGVTGRIEQDKHRTPEGWRVDHSVLIDQLDLPPEQKEPKEEQ